MKIKNLKKFIRSIFLILILFISILLLIGKACYSNKQVEYKVITVSEGDTLWNIAKSYQVNNEYYKGKDVRYIINDLIKINDLGNSNIKENQELKIPVIPVI